MKYNVYKFSIKGTPFFYIGITIHLQTRCARHAGIINSYVKDLRFDRTYGGCKVIGHLLVAKTLIKGKRFLSIENSFDKSWCFIEVIHTTDDVKEAVMLETEYLQRYKDDVNCFNTEKESRYYNRPFKKQLVQ